MCCTTGFPTINLKKEFFNPKFSVLQIRKNKEAFVIGIEFQAVTLVFRSGLLYKA